MQQSSCVSKREVRGFLFTSLPPLIDNLLLSIDRPLLAKVRERRRERKNSSSVSTDIVVCSLNQCQVLKLLLLINCLFVMSK